MTFFAALVFALTFFGVWSLKECASTTGQPRTIAILIALVFIVLAWGLSRLA